MCVGRLLQKPKRKEINQNSKRREKLLKRPLTLAQRSSHWVQLSRPTVRKFTRTRRAYLSCVRQKQEREREKERKEKGTPVHFFVSLRWRRRTFKNESLPLEYKCVNVGVTDPCAYEMTSIARFSTGASLFRSGVASISFADIVCVCVCLRARLFSNWIMKKLLCNNRFQEKIIKCVWLKKKHQPLIIIIWYHFYPSLFSKKSLFGS